MAKKKKLSGGHIDHLGFTIPGFAEEVGVPDGMVRRAVENGEVEFVWFGGLRRIPPREVERLRAFFKISSPA